MNVLEMLNTINFYEKKTRQRSGTDLAVQRVCAELAE